MGTNYYLHQKKPCEACGRGYEPLHIGKSSGGWCFALRVDPDNGIHDLPDWEDLWGRPGVTIENEYGDAVSIDEMRATILARSWPRGPQHHDAAFLEQNYAEDGPHGLLRRRIMPRHCIGHGSGTYDLCVGDFS